MDTDQVEIPSSLNELTEQLAENVHEVWSKGRKPQCRCQVPIFKKT